MRDSAETHIALSLAGVGSSWPGLRFWATMTVAICVSPILATTQPGRGPGRVRSGPRPAFVKAVQVYRVDRVQCRGPDTRRLAEHLVGEPRLVGAGAQREE
jgi:hypothetical protein